MFRKISLIVAEEALIGPEALGRSQKAWILLKPMGLPEAAGILEAAGIFETVEPPEPEELSEDGGDS